jgi:hypothetical protein
MSRKKLKQATDADVCYTIVDCFLDGKMDGLVRRHDLHPILREVCQKINALKLSLAVACKVSALDKAEIEKVSLARVIETEKEWLSLPQQDDSPDP